MHIHDHFKFANFALCSTRSLECYMQKRRSASCGANCKAYLPAFDTLLGRFISHLLLQRLLTFSCNDFETKRVVKVDFVTTDNRRVEQDHMLPIAQSKPMVEYPIIIADINVFERECREVLQSAQTIQPDELNYCIISVFEEKLLKLALTGYNAKNVF